MPLPWRIKLLGELSVQRGDEPAVRFDTRQTAALLAYLAFYRDRTHSREVLADQLWPDEDTEATRSRLRTAIWALRRALESQGSGPGAVFMTDRSEISLVSSACSTDIGDFEQALRTAKRATGDIERATHFKAAVELYTGELLPGYYEEWITRERERIAETYRAALGEAASACAACGSLTEGIGYARKAVDLDPLQEPAHAALIALYIQAGRSVDAIRQYKELERVLHVEMGLKPSAEMRKLLDFIQRPPSSPASGSVSVQPVQPASSLQLEPEGGAVPLDSPFYIERKVDTLFTEAVARQDSIVLIKGARQMGKTSLLARGLRQARESGTRVVLTDFQNVTAAQMETSDSLFLTLTRSIADQLDMEISLDDLWHTSWGWNVNFERFLRREVLTKDSRPIVWALDEADRLFGHPYTADVFGLFRSWHNARSLDPSGPWSRLTLAISYATEAHLFITDLNQSPFNVGTRLALEDFAPGEVSELNRRYSSPLSDEEDVSRYIRLVGGHPYLVRRGLHTMAENSICAAVFEAAAEQEDGPFGDHLRRMRTSLLQSPDLSDAARTILTGQPCPSNEAFFRLQSAGVITGHSPQEAIPRCDLYRRYLERHLL